MAHYVGGSVYEASCPQLRRMHRKCHEKWQYISRCLVVVQQSRFQELTNSRQGIKRGRSVRAASSGHIDNPTLAKQFVFDWPRRKLGSTERIAASVEDARDCAGA